MKPERGIVFEADTPCDFGHVGLEDGFDMINAYVREHGILTTESKYLYVGIECDLLRIIDLSRTYSLWPSFKKDYGMDEWSLHVLNKTDYSHIIYWSSGA